MVQPARENAYVQHGSGRVSLVIYYGECVRASSHDRQTPVYSGQIAGAMSNFGWSQQLGRRQGFLKVKLDGKKLFRG